MTARYRVAAVQMNSGEDVAANLRAAVELVEQAAQRGAQLVVLPEMFACLGKPAAIVAAAEAVPGPTSVALAGLASRLGITLVAGSIAERSPEPEKVYNTCLVFGPQGETLARYRKIHLFDVDLPGAVTMRESSWSVPGVDLAIAQTGAGRLGIAICYDLRFPELFRALVDAQAEVLALPSAFTLATGRDHWEVLLRARAIENQVYVVAANQCGQHGSTLVTCGRSLVVDPWGIVVAMAPDGVGLALAEIDLARVREVRARLPALAHRRLPT